MSLTNEIIMAVGKRQVLRNHTPVVANVTTMFDWEVDLFSVNKAGLTYEFEIKISRSDFLADRKKKKWEMYGWKPKSRLPNFMAYVCPDGLIKETEIPDFSGLFYYVGGEIVEIKKAKLVHEEVKDFKEINFKIARMYSQRHFLGRTLISHINMGIRERNKQREKERKEAQDKWMKFLEDNKKKNK